MGIHSMLTISVIKMELQIHNILIVTSKQYFLADLQVKLQIRFFFGL